MGMLISCQIYVPRTCDTRHRACALQFLQRSVAVGMSHNGGQDARDRDNHGRVLRDNDQLTDAGYTTWCDSEQMIGDVVDRMVDGIDNTHAVLVFVTRRYMEKVASSTGVQDNCKKEFTYATRRLGEAKMIPVIMEPDMRDCSRWTGRLAMELGGTLWVDMSDDAAVRPTSDGFARLCSEIDGRMPGRTCGSFRASLFQSSDSSFASNNGRTLRPSRSDDGADATPRGSNRTSLFPPGPALLSPSAADTGSVTSGDSNISV